MAVGKVKEHRPDEPPGRESDIGVSGRRYTPYTAGQTSRGLDVSVLRVRQPARARVSRHEQLAAHCRLL